MDNEKLEEIKRFSYIGMHSGSNIVYAMQYKEAFDTLYNSKKAVDTIALPMMFLMRHYLELILKYNIKYLNEFSDTNFLIGSLNSVHSLEQLADGFKQHWNSVVQKHNIDIDDSQYILDFENLIDFLHNLDKFSMSFRYSHDKNDEKNFEHMRTLNIKEIKDSLEKVVPLLNYSINVFYQQKGQFIEMEEQILKNLENEIMSEMYSSYY